MDILRDWIFVHKKIMTPNIMAGLSNLNIDSASDLLYKFYNKNKVDLSAMFLVTTVNQKSTTVSTERMSHQELLTLISSKSFQLKIVSIKIWALCVKRDFPLSVQDVVNAEEYELNNKDSKFQKLRFLDIEDKTRIFASQHSIVKSQVTKETNAPLESSKKTFFSRSNTQNNDKDNSDLSRQSSKELPSLTQDPKKSKRDSFEIIPEDDDGFTRKSKRTKKTTPNSNDQKQMKNIIEID